MNLARGAVRMLTVALGTVLVVADVRAARERHRRWVAWGRYADVEVTDALTVPAALVTVYDVVRDPARLADRVRLPGRIERVDTDRYRWTGDPVAPPGLVEIVGDIPAVTVSWRATGGPLPHEGTLKLSSPDGTRTRVGVTLRYRWSHEWADRAGVPDDAPARILSDALARLADSLRPDGGTP